MIRVGLLGPGRIVERVMADMHNAREVTISAVASRSLERAQAAAARYGIPHAYGSYEKLAQSPEVDLVYIATPHPFHVEQACLMMKHGKHVLCEKPMTVNDAGSKAMIDCARTNKVFLMEAMWTRFVPATIKARELLAGGAIGTIRHMFGDFSYAGTYNAEDRVYALELAGGALLDLGVYPLMEITMLLGWHPVKASALCCKAPTGADTRMCAQLLFDSGATAQFFCGMDAAAPQSMMIYGSEGVMEIPEFWHPHIVIVRRNGCPEERYEFPEEHEGHHYEFDHAAQCVAAGLTESPVVTLEESLAVSRLCTQLRRDMGVAYPMDRKEA